MSIDAFVRDLATYNELEDLAREIERQEGCSELDSLTRAGQMYNELRAVVEDWEAGVAAQRWQQQQLPLEPAGDVA